MNIETNKQKTNYDAICYMPKLPTLAPTTKIPYCSARVLRVANG